VVGRSAVVPPRADRLHGREVLVNAARCRYDRSMTRTAASFRSRLAPLLVLAACAPPPPPAPPPAAAPSADEVGARRAAEVALASLAKRNFEVGECSASEARFTGEAEARAGAPIGDRCSVLTAHRADRTWLVVVRAAIRSAPTRAGGALAIVTVTAGGEGVAHIEYGR
jgi:hypothetical protein